ncbi:MAG: hypothetical protein OQL19_15030 [Gammaproteobacteria bacterium]|nr:hypothetical protein [Gammaproteobacteria bacterium]
MIKIIIIASILFLLSACDAYHDMTSMFEKQGLVQDYIKTKTGYDTHVGFNINNGTLVQVTVYFQSNDVENDSIKELEQISLAAVAKSFKLKPQVLNVAIQSIPNDENYEKLQAINENLE